MARVTQIRDPLGGADNVSLIELIRGEAFVDHGQWVDDDEQAEGENPTPVDITGFTITAHAEFYTGIFTGAAPSALQRVDTIPVRALEVEVLDAKAGAFDVKIPADLYPNAIEVDLTADVPMAIIWTKHVHDATSTVVDQYRDFIVFRRGQPPTA